MRRIFAIMLLAASSVAALCQEPNKQLQELEKYLKQQESLKRLKKLAEKAKKAPKDAAGEEKA